MTTTGSDGQPGQVTFIVYDAGTSLSESFPTPFQLGFVKKKIDSLKPQPVIAGKRGDNETVFPFGSQILYGPVSVVNNGSMDAPASTFCSELCVHSDTRSIVLNSTQSFPPVPRSSSSKHGSLSSADDLTVAFTLPSLAEAGFSLSDVEAFPWPATWSSQSRLHATFSHYITVQGVKVMYDPADTLLASDVIRKFIVDTPLELMAVNGSHGVSFPGSFVLSGSAVDLSCTLRSKLTSMSVDPTGWSVRILVAGRGFYPDVTGGQTVSQLPSSASLGSYCISRAVHDALALLPGETQLLSLGLLTANIPETLIGSNIAIRAELCYNDAVVQHTPALCSRITSLMPRKSKVTELDLLVFTSHEVHSATYQALRQIGGVLGMQVHFLDVEHFASTSSNMLEKDSWADFFGKATVIFAPRKSSVKDKVPIDHYAQHVQAGGCVIFGPTLGYSSALRSLPQAAILPSAFDLNSLVAEMPAEAGRLKTGSAALLTDAIVTCLSLNTRFLMAFQKHPMKSVAIQPSTLSLTAYADQLMPAGCCGSSSLKVCLPLGKREVTVGALAMRSFCKDLTTDLQSFNAGKTDMHGLPALTYFMEELMRVSSMREASGASIRLGILRQPGCNLSALSENKEWVKKFKKTVDTQVATCTQVADTPLSAEAALKDTLTSI
ncbi:hypothetical protein EON64_15370, partial [archaeon]